MFHRFRLFAVSSAACTLLLLAGCSNTGVGSIQITPSSQSLAAGQTAQFTATGIIGHGSHPTSSKDITSQVTWKSSSSDIATISSSGMVTAVSAGTATIAASMPGATSGTATVTVTGGGSGGSGGGSGGSGGSTNNKVATLSIIPSSQSVVASPSQTTQFLAIGTTTSGATLDLTGQVNWKSSVSSVAAISSGGLATSKATGTTTITAIATNSDNTVANASATLTVTSGSQEAITSLTITPGSQSLSASGQTGQLIALGTSGTTGQSQDVTDATQLQWISSIPSVASVTSGGASGNGMVTGRSAGTTSITAIWTNSDGTVVTSTPATITVSLTAPPSPLLSLQIIPASLSVGDLQDTGQFLAIGTFSTAPYVQDVTNSPNTTWLSSFPDSFPVNTNSGGTSSASAGIVTAYGTGSTTIIAEYQDPTTHSIQTATATFSCPLVLPNPNGNPPTPGSCWTGQTGPLKATLTIYGEGLNTTNWLVTAPSATGTPDVIHCGPGWGANGNSGGSVCVGIYPIGTKVLLTAPTQTGVAFGGWTYNCTPSDANGNKLPGPTFWTATGPNYCTISLGTTNATVGAIFNNQ